MYDTLLLISLHPPIPVTHYFTVLPLFVPSLCASLVSNQASKDDAKLDDIRKRNRVEAS